MLGVGRASQHAGCPLQQGPAWARRSAAVARAAPRCAAAMSALQPAAADPESREALVEDAVVWAVQHGLVVGAGLETPAVATLHAPMALLPVAYPRATFQRAKAAACVFNSMIDRVAADGPYLEAVLASAAVHDEFTARLLKAFQATAGARAAGAERVLAVNRSDYMLHEPTASLLQVEINTIASSFGCLSTLVARMHRHLLERAGAGAEELEALPTNNAMDEIADAIAAAATAYASSSSGGGDAAAGAAAGAGEVLMVVQPGERNAYDQYWLQARLWERHRVRTLRRPLATIAAHGALDASGRLVVEGRPISVVYFRAGYTPDDYHGEAEWAARELVERSDAFKCPTLAYQLAGAKKVQQDLARPGVLERYVDGAGEAGLLRSLFAGLWGLEDLDDSETAAVVGDAIARPEGYVLKPQREGGGNNIYGAALAARLAGSAGGGLAAYILMQRILPPVNRAVMVRAGVAVEADTLSELGIYGTYVREGPRVLLNREAGHLVRTKAATSDEGGVAAGFAVLDSPVLV